MGLGEGVPVTLQNRPLLAASVLGWGLLFVAGGGSGGCALVSRPPAPDPAPEAAPELPADFVESPAAGSYQPQEWWRAFADPVLDEVVDLLRRGAPRAVSRGGPGPALCGRPCAVRIIQKPPAARRQTGAYRQEADGCAGNDSS